MADPITTGLAFTGLAKGGQALYNRLTRKRNSRRWMEILAANDPLLFDYDRSNDPTSLSPTQMSLRDAHERMAGIDTPRTQALAYRQFKRSEKDRARGSLDAVGGDRPGAFLYPRFAGGTRDAPFIDAARGDQGADLDQAVNANVRQALGTGYGLLPRDLTMAGFDRGTRLAVGEQANTGALERLRKELGVDIFRDYMRFGHEADMAGRFGVGVPNRSPAEVPYSVERFRNENEAIRSGDLEFIGERLRAGGEVGRNYDVGEALDLMDQIAVDDLWTGVIPGLLGQWLKRSGHVRLKRLAVKDARYFLREIAEETRPTDKDLALTIALFANSLYDEDVNMSLLRTSVLSALEEEGNVYALMDKYPEHYGKPEGYDSFTDRFLKESVEPTLNKMNEAYLRHGGKGAEEAMKQVQADLARHGDAAYQAIPETLDSSDALRDRINREADLAAEAGAREASGGSRLRNMLFQPGYWQ